MTEIYVIKGCFSMKIVIMKAKNKDIWYKDKIGERYTVVDETSITYIVKVGKEYKSVDKDDCEVIGKFRI